MKLITTTEYVDALDKEIGLSHKRIKELIAFVGRCADHMISGSNIADTPLPTEDEWKYALRPHEQIDIPSPRRK